MQFIHTFITLLFEARGMSLLSTLSSDKKVDRLSKHPYSDGKYYHNTKPENLENILKNGFSGKEIWFSKDKPHSEYSGGILFELDLFGYDLKPDPRWKGEHQVFISTEPIPSDRITKVYEYIEEVGLREDELALQMKNATEEQIKDILQKYGI